MVKVRYSVPFYGVQASDNEPNMLKYIILYKMLTLVFCTRKV